MVYSPLKRIHKSVLRGETGILFKTHLQVTLILNPNIFQSWGVNFHQLKPHQNEVSVCSATVRAQMHSSVSIEKNKVTPFILLF